MRRGYERPRLTAGTVFRFIGALLFLIGYFVAYILFSENAQLADDFSEITKVIALMLSGAMSYIPVVAAEWLLYILLFSVIAYILFILFKTILYPGKIARILRAVSNLSLGASLLLFLFMMLFGANYFCTSIAKKMELSVSPSTVEELAATTKTILEHANEYAAIVPRNEEGVCEFGTFTSMSMRLSQGYRTLSDEYIFLKSSYAPAKPASSWFLMSSFGIAGIYIPYTGESVVNPDTPEPAILFHMAHEMAHRLAIAPEDEANFVAFMACRASNDRYVKYAGYYMAYRYCLNALYAESPETALEVHGGASSDLLFDIQQFDEHIRKYEGPVQEAGEKMNDTYLKSLSQTDGVKSYGRMVDLLIAEYKNGDPEQ